MDASDASDATSTATVSSTATSTNTIGRMEIDVPNTTCPISCAIADPTPAPTTAPMSDTAAVSPRFPARLHYQN